MERQLTMKPAIKLPRTHGRWTQMFEVFSDSRPVSYVVAKDRDGNWACSCPRWIFTTPRKDCKHISHVQTQLQSRVEMPVCTEQELQSKPKVLKAISRFALIEI